LTYLQNAVQMSASIDFSTEELRCLLSAAKFTLELLRAIEADYWFENVSSSSSSNESNSATGNETGGAVVPEDNNLGSLFEVKKARDGMTSVAQLLQLEKPGIYCPRAVIVEIDRVEREFQNQQVEVRLVHALLTGRDYLRQTENFENIVTDELQEVVDIASSLRVRSLRNSKLFDAATKILHLRHAVKLGDWVAIRYCLFEASKSSIVPEAEYELKELMLISEERNHRMHVTVTEAIKNNRVSGSYMKLDATAVDAMQLLAALRGAINVPKISHEDKQVSRPYLNRSSQSFMSLLLLQLIYTAEKLKNIRISILMSDYDRLVAETSSTDLSMICSEGLEEMLLVKKAIDFFQNIKQVNQQLVDGRCLGVPGQLETQNLSIYQLSNSLAAFHLSDCELAVKQFLCCGLVLRDIRAATKGARWATTELSNLLIDFVIRQRELIRTLETRQQLLQQQGQTEQAQAQDHQAFLEQFQLQRDMDQQEHFSIDYNSVKVIQFDYQHEMFGSNVVLTSKHLTNRADYSLRFDGLSSNSANKANNGGTDNSSGYKDAYPYEMAANINRLSASSHPSGASGSHSSSHVDVSMLGLPPYRDIPQSELHMIDMLNHSSLDPLCLPRLLGSMTFVMESVSGEVLLLRDECYNRVSIAVLRRGLSYQSLFTEAIHYSGYGESEGHHPNPMEPGQAVGIQSADGSNANGTNASVDLDAAIEVVCLLGCKSKESLRLLHTAYYMRKLRASVQQQHQQHFSSRSTAAATVTSVNRATAKQTLQLLSQVWEMKSNGLFDPIAVAEVDDVFHHVCSINLKDELYSRLRIPPIANIEYGGHRVLDFEEGVDLSGEGDDNVDEDEPLTDDEEVEPEILDSNDPELAFLLSNGKTAVNYVRRIVCRPHLPRWRSRPSRRSTCVP
jgi:hypothetical protein